MIQLLQSQVAAEWRRICREFPIFRISKFPIFLSFLGQGNGLVEQYGYHRVSGVAYVVQLLHNQVATEWQRHKVSQLVEVFSEAWAGNTAFGVE